MSFDHAHNPCNTATPPSSQSACSVRPSKDQTFIHTTQHRLLRQTKQRSDIHTHNPTPPASSDQAKIRHSYTQPNTACSVRPSKDQTFVHTTQHRRQQTLSPSVSSNQPAIPLITYTQPNTANTQSCFVRSTSNTSDHTQNPTPPTLRFSFVRPTSNTSDHTHN